MQKDRQTERESNVYSVTSYSPMNTVINSSLSFKLWTPYKQVYLIAILNSPFSICESSVVRTYALRTSSGPLAGLVCALPDLVVCNISSSHYY